jgi:pSer/pThr/pTyr-binding forkhead associated (FHA) protein
MHANILCDNSGISHIKDLRSTNGTFVQSAIGESAIRDCSSRNIDFEKLKFGAIKKLENGFIVRFGLVEMKYMINGNKDTSDISSENFNATVRTTDNGSGEVQSSSNTNTSDYLSEANVKSYLEAQTQCIDGNEIITEETFGNKPVLYMHIYINIILQSFLSCHFRTEYCYQRYY